MNLILMFLMLFCGSAAPCGGGDTLKINDCYKQVYEKYPSVKQIELYKSASLLKRQNLDINYLPQVSLKGQATYQSEVTKLELTLPNFKTPDFNKDRYQVTLDVRQLVYDGGLTNSLKDVESAQTLVEQQKVEVEVYQLKQKIDDLYFNILLIQEKERVTKVLYEDIKSKLTELESKIKNGVIPASNRYSLEAELIKVQQDLYELKMTKSSTINMLGDLMNKKLSEDIVLDTPAPVIGSKDYTAGQRPEYKLFELQKSSFNALRSNVLTRIIPKVSVFGQAGYGRPGLNFLDNTFQPFYTVGLNVSWNPLNWGADNNDMQIYRINEEIIDKQRETFDKNLKVNLEKYISDIDKLDEMIIRDREIIELRKKSVSGASSQLENGTITSTVYLTEINVKSQAEITLKTHEIQLIQAKINYLTLKGNKFYE